MMPVLQEGLEDPGALEWEAGGFPGGFSSGIWGQSESRGQREATELSEVGLRTRSGSLTPS